MRLSVIAIVVALIGLVIGNTWTWPLARAFVGVTNTDRSIRRADDPSDASLQAGGIDRQFRVRSDEPEVSLFVWVIEPTLGASTPATQGSQPRGTVLLIHGINTDRRSLVGMAKRLAAADYRSVLVDLRAHGRSSGRWCTFGRRESREMVQVIDELERRGLLAAPLMSWGQSLGGAVAIQHAAIDPRVRCVVALSTFRSYRSVVPLYVRRLLPVIGMLILPSTIDRAVDHAGRIGGFDPDAADPAKTVASMSTPVLLVHGSDDRNIPPAHSQAIRDAAPDRCELVILPGAGHNTTLGPAYVDEVTRRSLGWFSRHASPPPPR